MLSVQGSDASNASTDDRRVCESAYTYPSPSTEESLSSSGPSSATTSASTGTSRSQYVQLLHLKLKQRATQIRKGRKVSKACPVCWCVDCNVNSHKEWVTRQRTQLSSVASDRSSPPGFALSLPIGSGKLDPFIPLPIESAPPEATRFFRDFFSCQVSNLYQTPRVLGFDNAYTPRLLIAAHTDSAVFHSCIAMGATFAAIHGRNLKTPDERLSSIYDTALRTLRVQLKEENDEKPRSTTVMAAVNLIMAQAIGMRDKAALVAHRTGIKTFVDSWGGIHNLEPQLVSLINWTDYWSTLFTGLPPLYTELLTKVEFHLEKPPAHKYGRAYDEPRMRGIVGTMLLENCLITSRLVELLEDKVNKTSSPARWQYFNYKRDVLATRCGIVHSELFGLGNKPECIGIATNLIIVLVLRMIPWTSPANELCDQLQLAIVASGATVTCWKTDIDILIYILFVLVAAADHWENSQWAVDLLHKCLTVKYGPSISEWATNWQEQEMFNLRRFIWSEIFLDKSFDQTCHKMESMSQRHFENKDDDADNEESDCGLEMAMVTSTQNPSHNTLSYKLPPTVHISPLSQR